MHSDERTSLLAKIGADEPVYEEGSDGKAAETAESGKTFGLWQIGALLGILLAYADTSLVWATHETVASQFNHLENSSWMMTSFTIGYCITLPLYGRMSDNYGRLRPLIAAYCTFCVGCTLCGLGTAFWVVILGRIVTGFGASGIISLASIIITDFAAPSNVAVLRSYVNIASTVGLSLGGPFGGFLGGTIGWRWSFLGQVPIAICCCILLARGLNDFLSNQEDEDERTLEGCSNDVEHQEPGFDYPGAIALGIWMSALLTVIDLQNQLSWGHPLILSFTSIGAVSLIAFLALEAYPGNREPLIPLRLLKTDVGAFCAGQLLILGGCHGFVSHIAPYFSNTQGASDAEGGLRIIPASIGNAVGSLIAGQVIKKFGSYKKLSLISLLFSFGSSTALIFLWSHRIGVWGTLSTFPYGVFAGIVLSTQFIGLYHCAPKQHMATAISMYYMSQQLGIAMGISVCSTLLKRQFRTTALNVLADVPGYEEIINSILTDSSLVNLLPMEIKSKIWLSYLKSFWVVPAFVTAVQAIALFPMASTSEKYVR